MSSWQMTHNRKGIIEAQQGDACMKAISKCNANHSFSCSLLPIQMNLSNDDVIGIEARHWRKRITPGGFVWVKAICVSCNSQIGTCCLLAQDTSHNALVRYKHITIQNKLTKHKNTTQHPSILKKTTKSIPKHDTRLHRSPKTQCKKQQSTAESHEDRADAAKFPISLGFTTRAGQRAIAFTLTWILAFFNLQHGFIWLEIFDILPSGTTVHWKVCSAKSHLCS